MFPFRFFSVLPSKQELDQSDVTLLMESITLDLPSRERNILNGLILTKCILCIFILHMKWHHGLVISFLRPGRTANALCFADETFEPQKCFNFNKHEDLVWTLHGKAWHKEFSPIVFVTACSFLFSDVMASASEAQHHIRVKQFCCKAQLFGIWKEPRLSLNQLNDGADTRGVSLQDEDRFGNDPHLVPGFLRLCSGNFPEQFRRVSVSVGLREIRLLQTEQPKCGTLPAEFVEQFFSYPVLNLIGNLELVDSRNGRVSWLLVPRMFLLCFSCNGCQLSFVSQCCHLLEGKILKSSKDWIFFCLNKLESTTRPNSSKK